MSGLLANGLSNGTKTTSDDIRNLHEKYHVDMSDSDPESFGCEQAGGAVTTTSATVTNSNLNFQNLILTNNGSRNNYAAVAKANNGAGNRTGNGSSNGAGNRTGNGSSNGAGNRTGFGARNGGGNGNVASHGRQDGGRARSAFRGRVGVYGGRFGRKGWEPPTRFVAVIDGIDLEKFGSAVERLAEFHRIAPRSRILGEYCLDGNGISVYFDTAESLDGFMKSECWAQGAFGVRAHVHPPSGKHGDGPKPTEKTEEGKLKVFNVPRIGHDRIVSQFKEQHGAGDVVLLNPMSNLYMLKFSPERAKSFCDIGVIDFYSFTLNVAPMMEFIAFDHICDNCSERHRHSTIACQAKPKCRACSGPHRTLQAPHCPVMAKQQWVDNEIAREVAAGAVVGEGERRRRRLDAMTPVMKCGECGKQHVAGFGGCEVDKRVRREARQRDVQAKMTKQNEAEAMRRRYEEQRRLEERTAELSRQNQQAVFDAQARQQAQRTAGGDPVQRQRETQARLRVDTQQRLDVDRQREQSGSKNARRREKQRLAKQASSQMEQLPVIPHGSGAMDGVEDRGVGSTTTATTQVAAVMERPMPTVASSTPTLAVVDQVAVDALINTRLEAMIEERMTKMMAMVISTMLKAFTKGARANVSSSDDSEAKTVIQDVVKVVIESVKMVSGTSINIPTLTRELESFTAQLWVV